MSEREASPDLSESPALPLEDALDLLAYLITAADLCRHEPLHYGMFRLVDGASRLAGALETSGAAAELPWIADLRSRIDAEKELLMWDRPAFERFLEETAASLALHLSDHRGVPSV